ncbi:MAG: putative Ig domain-containing protein [Paludibaculum sp.]
MTMKAFILLWALFLPLLAQTRLYVPSGPTRCVASATNATPIVISTTACDNSSLAAANPTPQAHGWSDGAIVVVAGVEGNIAANGTRVATHVTATTAELYDLNGAPVAGSGAFQRYTGGSGTSYPQAASGVQVTLKDHPRVWLDGPGGTLTSTLCTNGAECKAVNGNPAWAAMKTAIDLRVVSKDAASPDQPLISQMQNGDFGYLSGAALIYQSTGTTRYRDWAIKALNNIDKYTKGFGCANEQFSGCGDSITLDYASKYLWNIAQTYSIVRSGMTAKEREVFAGKMLNDVNDSCTNRFYAGTGTINYTIYQTTLTGNGTQWLTNPDVTQRIAPGDSLMWTSGCTSGYCAGMTMIVSAVTSDTSLTISGFPSGSYANTASNAPFWIAKPWTTGNCGLVSFLNHSSYSPIASGHTHPSIYINGAPTSFGGATVYARDESTRSELYNQNITKGLGFLAIALALADDDPKALGILQRLMFWWKDYWYPLQRQWSTGAMQITAKYYATRVQPFTLDFAVQLRNSFTEPVMDFTGGNWLKAPLSMWVYGYNRAANSGTRWGGAAPATMEPNHWKGGLGSASLQPDSDESKAWKYILKNWTGFWGSAETQFAYGNMGGYPGNFLYYDPTSTEADPNSTLPLSRNMTASDTGTLGEGTGLVVSRTGWQTDSSILEIHASSIFKATNLYGTGYSGDPGSYKIFKRFYLLAEDYGKGVQPTFSAYCGPNEQSNYMRIGPYTAASPSLLQRGNFKSQIQYVKTPRFWNDPNNEATYAMVDYAGAYQPSAHIAFAHRHFAHFKKQGRNEYVIAADSVRTTDGQTKVTFLHYPNNEQPGVFENGTTAWAANPTEGTTEFNASAGKVISSSPSSRIVTQVLQPDGPNSLRVYTDNPNGSYTGTSDPAKGPLGGAGQTFRVSICASADGTSCDAGNLKTNVLVAHRVVEGTGETENPAALLTTIDANFVGMQVDDGPNSIVALFPSEDQTLSTATFTSTHANQARYLVSGLAAGMWTVLKDGLPLDLVAKVDDSGVLYWEGSAGNYVLTRTGAGPLAVATDSLPPAATGAVYLYPLVALGGTPPYSWSITVGGLPDGIVLQELGLITGTAQVSGDFGFRAVVTDSEGQIASKDLALSVSTTPLTILTSSLEGGVVGQPYVTVLVANGGVGPYVWSVVNGTLCDGLSLSEEGAISGQPTASGACTFRVRVSDQGGLKAERDFELMVVGSESLSILVSRLPDGLTGFEYSGQLQGSGGIPPLHWSISAGSLPDGVSLDSDTGALTGMPVNPGRWVFTVRLTDNSTPNLQAEKELSITINDGLGLLVLVTSELPAVRAGADYRALVQVKGGEPPYEFQANRESLPEGLTLSATGLLSGRPITSGDYSVNVKVSDNRGAAHAVSAVLPMTVQPAAGLRLETADASSGALLLRYGQAGLGAGQSCRVDLAGDANFTQPLATVTDAGGPALRWAAFGPGLNLQPDRLYYAKADCGGQTATLTAATRPAGRAGAGTTAVNVPAPAGANGLRIDYGGTADLGSRVETACAAGQCTASIPAVSGQPLYYQATYLAAGQVSRQARQAVVLAR